MSFPTLEIWEERAAALSSNLAPFIDGAYRPSASSEIFEKFNPANGDLLHKLPAGSREDVDIAVRSARAAFADRRWSGLSLARRKTILFDFAALIERHAHELALMDSIEVGKPIQDTVGIDLPLTIGIIRYCAESVDKVMGESSFVDDGTLAVLARNPRGVIGASIGWNFPLVLAIQKIAPALAMGNTVVLKPSELSSLSAFRLAELAVEAGIPAGVLNVVPGIGPTVGDAISHHPDIDMISFTGSSATGKRIMQASGASNMKRLLLECGGKSANIVFPDVEDLDAAADGVVGRMFWNQGQVCTAGTRLIVHADIRDALVEKVIARLDGFRIGNPLDPQTSFGPLVSEPQMRKVLRYIDQGSEQGARLSCGGQRVLGSTGGFFVEPTIFDDVSETMTIAREEIFGPVLSVMSFDTVNEALRLGNATDFGLSATLWTSSISVMQEAMRTLRVGELSINACARPTPGAMFGSLPLEPHKQSGVGTESGPHGLLAYTALTSVQIHSRRY